MDLDGEALLMQLSDDIPAGLKQPKLYQSHHAPAVDVPFERKSLVNLSVLLGFVQSLRIALFELSILSPLFSVEGKNDVMYSLNARSKP